MTASTKTVYYCKRNPSVEYGEIEGKYKRDTEKALLISFQVYDPYNGGDIRLQKWVPKSIVPQATLTEDPVEEDKFTVAMWFLEREKLI